MTTLTSPDNIASPDGSEPFDPSGSLGSLATSVQVALNSRQIYTFQWADANGRVGQVGMRAGDEGYQTDTAITYKYTGSAWKAWHSSQPTAFTPAWTNLTLGNGSQAFTYALAAGRVAVSGWLLFGSTSSITASNPYMTAPLALNNYQNGSPPNSGSDRLLGNTMMAIAGASFPGSVTTFATGGIVYARPIAINAASTYGAGNVITSLVPGTWATGSYMTFDYSYMAD